MKRFQIIAPNGKQCSAIWADKEKTMLQTWSGKRRCWESFPVLYGQIDKECVLNMASETNPIVNIAENKIEFKDGTTFARDFRTNKYHKVKNFMMGQV